LLYEDETILWRFALPRAGWWRTAQRARLSTRPLSQSQIKRDEEDVSEVLVCYSLGVYESQSNPQRNRVTR